MAVRMRVWVENLEDAMVADVSVLVAVSVVPLEVVLGGVVEGVVAVTEGEEEQVVVVVVVVAGVDVVGIKTAKKAIILMLSR